VVSGDHSEIAPASVVHPNTLLVRAPAISSGARGIAMLRHKPHSTSRVHPAVMLSHVVGVARNRLRISVVVPILVVIAAVMIHVTICPALIRKVGVPPDREIRTASVVHPDTPLVGAPTVALGASGFAVLRQ